jgi:hypothetical protein
VSQAGATVGDDKLVGTEAIAAELGVSRRRAQYYIEKGLIPVGRFGVRYVASKRRLREHFEALAAGETVR